MKHLILLPFFLMLFLLLNSCKDDELIYAPPGYAYLQHSAFSLDTSQWFSTGYRVSYTVTMQNLGTVNANVIRTQLFFKEPTTVEQSTAYLKWVNSDNSAIQIPPGGSATYTVMDSLSYRDSVLYWNLSYNSNPINNLP